MRVISTEWGYYVNRLVPPFTIFEADESIVTKGAIKLDEKGSVVTKVVRTRHAGLDHIPVRDEKKRELAAWLVLDTPENRKIIEEARRNGAINAKAAALASAGPKRAKRGFAVADGAEDSVHFLGEVKAKPEDLV